MRVEKKAKKAFKNSTSKKQSMKTQILVHLFFAFLIAEFINGEEGQLSMENPIDILNVSSSWHNNVSAMFVLGDSSVDCGDNTPLYPLLHESLSLRPCNNSDRNLLPHLLAEKMNLPYTPPFYTQNGSVEGLIKGVNFGSALATIMYSSSNSHQSLSQQLRQAFETIQLLELELGEETAERFVKSSLFYLSFGKDDYINYILHNSTGSSNNLNYTDEKFTYILFHQMTNAIRNLYGANVRRIICVGVLPLGCAPHILYWSNSTVVEGTGCVDKVNNLVVDYNTRLEEKIVALNAALPDVHIVFCDVYRAMMEFITNPKIHGFEDAKNACCGIGKFGGMNGCLSADMACYEASAHVWWDLFNPTQAVNTLLADSVWSGHPLSAISRPLTIQELSVSSV